MRILFTTDYRDAVSTVINAPNFARLGEIDGVSIDFYNRNYTAYDVVLFMGYDARVAEARQSKPSLKIGVIDLRPSMLPLALGADFIVANGIEMQDWCANHFSNIYIYPIYPSLQEKAKVHTKSNRIVIGYHGNKVHLHTLFPYISTALEALAEHYEVELWAVYNMETLGPCTLPLCDPTKVRVRHLQWSEVAYETYMSEVDIGIVPNLISIRDVEEVNRRIASFPAVFREHQTDYLLRFKATTNAGRLFVFAQYGIPVIADMVPSALQVIQDGYNGFVAYSAGGWYRALKHLADSPDLRQTFATRMKAEFRETWSVEALNEGFIEFLNHLDPQPSVPDRLAAAEARMDDPAFLHAARSVPATKPTRNPNLLKQLLRHWRKGEE
jgi:glycosyltransferase involved in cell wall biosynthesis